MTTPSLNNDFQRLQSLMQGRMPQDVLRFEVGQVLSWDVVPLPRLLFVEQGALVLQQPLKGRWIDAGWVDRCAGLAMVGGSSIGWRVQAVHSGWARVVTLTADALPLCADWLLPLQVRQQHQMALWGYCRQQHSLPQRLATWLSLLDNDATRWDWRHWSESLNTPPSFFEAALQALARTGALQVRGNWLELRDLDALRRQACTCLPLLACGPMPS